MSKLDELIRELCPNGVKYKKLVDAVSIERGKRVVRSQLSIRGKYPVYQNSLTPLGYHTDYNYNANTTFIIVAGAAGEIGFSDKAFWAADDCFTVVCPENVLNRYIYHYLRKDADGDAPISDHSNREDIEPHRDRQQLQKVWQH